MEQEGTVFLEGLLSVRVIDVWTSWTQELCASLVCEMWLVSFFIVKPRYLTTIVIGSFQ